MCGGRGAQHSIYGANIGAVWAASCCVAIAVASVAIRPVHKRTEGRRSVDAMPNGRRLCDLRSPIRHSAIVHSGREPNVRNCSIGARGQMLHALRAAGGSVSGCWLRPPREHDGRTAVKCDKAGPVGCIRRLSSKLRVHGTQPPMTKLILVLPSSCGMLFRQPRCPRVTVTRPASNAARRAGSKGERSTASVAPSRINSATASPVAGAFRIPQTLWPVATYAPRAPGTAPISGSPSCVTGRKQAWLARTREVARIGEMRSQSAFNLSIAPSSGATRSGSVGNGDVLEIAQTYVVPSARGKISGERSEPVASW